jgi:hypothetical protein
MIDRFTTRLTSSILAGGLLLLIPAPIEARPKVDTLILSNGDRLTCEIRELSRGILTVKTDYTKGTLSVEWDHVEEISSSQLFEVELTEGEKYYGAIAAASESARIVVMSGIGTHALELPDVVRIAQIDEDFWDRLDGSVDVGVTAKKANNERTYNLAAATKYRTRKYLVSSTVNSFLSDRTDTVATRRNDLSVTYSRFFTDRWFWSTYGRIENNEELQLDLRTTVLGGGGRYIVQSNRTLLGWTAGLAANREWYAGAEDSQDNLEAALILDYQLFVFGNRDTDIAIRLTALPNITSWGRIRSNLDAKLKHEFVSDLYFSLGILADYDSEPPTEGQKLDWNFTTSLGYSF